MPITNTAPKAPRSAQRPRKTKAKAIRLEPEMRRAMIEESAYFRAERRGFVGGDPVADWLASEREINDLLARDAH